MQIEVIRFSLASGVDERSFTGLNDRYQEDVAYQSAGLARRTVARDESGHWLDLRLWSDDSSRAMGGDGAVRHEWDAAVVVSSCEVYRGL